MDHLLPGFIFSGIKFQHTQATDNPDGVLEFGRPFFIARFARVRLPLFQKLYRPLDPVKRQILFLHVPFTSSSEFPFRALLAKGTGSEIHLQI
jgi:hypothetical protein